ncbi:MAG: hypothetical protein HYX26_05650 [Acidobacteriales bacterium]|nr:hypothetical protein [Terriglobales bacterium]
MRPTMRLFVSAVLSLSLTLSAAAQRQPKKQERKAPPAPARSEAAATGKVQSPSEFLGIQVGADRVLADYKQITAYFKALDAASDRVEVKSLGQTTHGNDMIMAVISSAENLRNQEQYKEIARKLADPRGSSPAQIDQLSHQGKLILLVTCNIHATEIGSSQMAMEWAYQLATAQDAETRKRLDDVILLLVPSLNPDGQIMVTDWYRKYVGTKYEGGAMPYLYHHYVGHDNNRDWYMLTQKETQNVTRMAYQEWYPQFWLDEHQMGAYGPRIYVPPNADPVAKLVNPLIHRGNNLLGSNMAWRLEEQNKQGVIFGYAFDAYWIGGTRNTGWWKNVFGVLTEVASARVATPMDIAPTELRGNDKGLTEYVQQINFPNPWRGGTWRLRDIMDYELIISNATLETASKYRDDFLHGVAKMAGEAIASGRDDEYYRLALDKQRDAVTATHLLRILREHNVEIHTTPDGRTFLIPTAQPYNRFLAELLGVQRYPEVKTSTDGAILEPYDVAAWSLPLMMGVDVEKVRLSSDEQRGLRPLIAAPLPRGGLEGSGKFYAIGPEQNATFALVNEMLRRKTKVYGLREGFFNSSTGRTVFPPGSVVFESNPELAAQAEQLGLRLTAVAALPDKAKPLREVRVGLYKPYVASIDEGWTRFVLDQYRFNLKSVENKAVRDGNLKENFDVLILPDVGSDVIVDGRPRRDGFFEEFPPEYQGGIGRDGIKAIKEFVDAGGTLITLASSADLVIEEFGLPVRNPLARVKDTEFNVPGSLLRVYLKTDHPVAFGMPAEIPAFQDEALAFQTAAPAPDSTRTVLAWYPDDEKDILLSGWIKGADKLERKAAAVSFTQGKGRIVMFGFRVQHRAQTEGTFKLLFNAIRWGLLE